MGKTESYPCGPTKSTGKRVRLPLPPRWGPADRTFPCGRCIRMAVGVGSDQPTRPVYRLPEPADELQNRSAATVGPRRAKIKLHNPHQSSGFGRCFCVLRDPFSLEVAAAQEIGTAVRPVLFECQWRFSSLFHIRSHECAVKNRVFAWTIGSFCLKLVTTLIRVRNEAASQEASDPTRFLGNSNGARHRTAPVEL